MNSIKSRSVIFTSMAVFMSSGANAAMMSLEQMQKLAKDKVGCESQINSPNNLSCDDVEQLFNQIKDSKNVELLQKIYIEQKVQMEMEYAGHSGG